VIARSDTDRAVRVARVGAALAFLGLVFDAATSPHLIKVSWVLFAACGVFLAMAASLTIWRRSASRTHANVAFLVINAAAITQVWCGTELIVASGVAWVPFRQYQLGALAVALLAPAQAWLGIATIAGYIGAAVIQLVLFEPEVRARLPYGDPWASVVYGAFAIVLFLHRLRSMHAEQAVVRAQAEAEGYETLARAMVALRDLSNTPLQTITNTVELLQMGDARSRELGDRLERALRKLIELQELTQPYERQLRWRSGDEAWDPREILRSISVRGTGTTLGKKP
jgi:hypothetical protein